MFHLIPFRSIPFRSPFRYFSFYTVRSSLRSFVSVRSFVCLCLSVRVFVSSFILLLNPHADGNPLLEKRMLYFGFSCYRTLRYVLCTHPVCSLASQRCFPYSSHVFSNCFSIFTCFMFITLGIDFLYV